MHDGYEIYVAEDCCGDVSQLAHDNAMKRVIQAGAKPVTSLSLMLELQRDWAEKDTYDAVMDIVKHHYGAYGIGVEYVYTMVHGAPPTKFPEYSVPAPAATNGASATSAPEAVVPPFYRIDRPMKPITTDLIVTKSLDRPMKPMTADLILTNGRVVTPDATAPCRRALAIRGETFLAVGDEKDVMSLAGPHTQRIDLGGRTVIPGLNDSHLHVIRGGLNYNMELRWDGVPSLADALEC